MVQAAPCTAFEPVATLEAGVRFQVETPSGSQFVAVASASDETMTIDGHQPLAEQQLHFEVPIESVRAATKKCGCT